MKECTSIVISLLSLQYSIITMALSKRPVILEPDPKRESFEELLRSKTFVDKSLFINMFFENDQTMYLTAPRGFGKTSIMNMLKTFCEVMVDPKGKPLSRNSTSNRKLLTEHNLAVMQDPEFVDDYFGLYPVAHFRFDRLKVGNGYRDFLNSFRDMLSDAYREHSYLQDSPRLDVVQKGDYMRMVGKNESGWLTQRGKDLTQLLKTHFSRESIILIDDFDAPLQQMLGNPRVSHEDVRTIHDFLKGFVVNLLRVNFFHFKSLVTACVRLVPPDVNSRVQEANNLVTVNFAQDDHVARFYGFNQHEVETLAKKLGRESEMSRIKDWYSGYPIESSEETLYNMYSILRFFEAGKLATYWKDAGNVRQILKPFFADGLLRLDIEGSLAVNNTKMKVVDGPYSFNTRNILILKDALENPAGSETKIYVKDLLLKYLMDHGYFSVREKTEYKGYVEAVIPTYEVKRRLQQYLNENSVKQDVEKRRGWWS